MDRLKGHRLRILGIALTLILMGGFVKTAGYIMFSSKAVLVDAITCIATALGGFVVLIATRASLKPPDLDHPYGHERVAYGGPLGVLVIYALSAGFSAAMLGAPEPYNVDWRASITALIGTSLYVLAIVVARLDPIGGSILAVFTFSEVIEGLVSAGASYAGATLSYVIDYLGGLVILAYLLLSLVRETRKVVDELSDIVEKGLMENVRRVLEERRFKVKSLRVRRVIPGKYHGDAVVEAPCDMPLEVANILVDEITDMLARNNIDLTVHIDKMRLNECNQRSQPATS